jgi:hypothetical protein
VNAAVLYLLCALHEVTYKETTMPVIEHYEKLGKVAQVSLAKFKVFAAVPFTNTCDMAGGWFSS